VRLSTIKHLFVALCIFALALAATAPARAMPMAAGGTGGVCPLCRINPAAGHTIPKMPLCGTPACCAAAVVATAPALTGQPLPTSTSYAIGADTVLADKSPKAEPPPPRLILSL
jgi:hypothetical protein